MGRKVKGSSGSKDSLAANQKHADDKAYPYNKRIGFFVGTPGRANPFGSGVLHE